MPKNLYQWLCAVAVLLVASAGWAQLASDISNEVIGGVPVIGLDVGAALPTSGLQKTADPGGSVAPWFGWQIGNNAGFTITPLLQAQFAGFTKGSSSGSSAPSFTSVGGGARASLNDDAAEVYLGAGGNYYNNSLKALARMNKMMTKMALSRPRREAK